MLQVAAPNEIVILLVFDLKVGDMRGMINLCIPASVVETTGTHFAQAWQRQRRELTPTERVWLDENLGRIQIPVMPLIQHSAQGGMRCVALQPGEVVALPLAADQALDVTAGGIRKLTGRLAADNGRLMLLVEQRCDRSAGTPTGVA